MPSAWPRSSRPAPRPSPSSSRSPSAWPGTPTRRSRTASPRGRGSSPRRASRWFPPTPAAPRWAAGADGTPRTNGGLRARVLICHGGLARPGQPMIESTEASKTRRSTMPKFTLLIGRKAMQVYDLDKETILIGREGDVDIVIDNPSVSRKHAQIRKEGAGWVVEDLGSSNGTFLHGAKITSAQPVKEGDEIGFGKFSVVFGKAVGDAVDQAVAKAAPKPMAADATGGTMQIKSHEVRELLKDSERKRRAHLQWEAGGRKGTHYLSDAPAVLFGTDELCDVKVPAGPKHHLLII
ncbi:MAG: FHA domain-containing protein [Gemmatimonadetes bacterium]|nr:FHA domain-containing protein [Gemmatimonadota bacterium]